MTQIPGHFLQDDDNVLLPAEYKTESKLPPATICVPRRIVQ